MSSFRLLPIVLVAITALLVFKGIGLLTGGAYVLTGTEFAAAQTATQSVAEADFMNQQDNDLTDAEATAARRAADSLFSRAAPTPIESQQIDALVVEENRLGEKVEFGSNDGSELTERAVLERLGERRLELDARERQLGTREDLVNAAESRLNARIAALDALEAEVQALVDKKNELDNQQFADLVSMYENMKAKDAALVFDNLDMDVLLRLSTSINPRKMSPILAEMQTARAQALTLLMAADQSDAPMSSSSDDFSELPQIVGQ